MWSLAARALLAGAMIAAISEIGKRLPATAAIVASLPLVSVLGMIFLWHERPDSENMAAHAQATFWYVLPSLPMFLLIPALLRGGTNFWIALGLGCALTVGLYLLMMHFAPRFGIPV
jgi:accessory gene regulator protein AgrB